jgi:hypothetical protein
MKNKKYLYSFIALLALATLASGIPALAENNDQPTNGTVDWKDSVRGNLPNKGMMNRQGKKMMKPVVFGTVTTINGNTLTVTGKENNGVNTPTTTFTVDATNAKIMKANVAGTISSIVVGDTVMIQGTITGTNVVAVMIRDGQMMGKGIRGDNNGNGNDNEIGKTPPVSPISGNGQPVIAGTISAVNGTSITITNKSNIVYTVDVTNAKIVRGQTTILASAVAVGDMVIVQGTFNGNSITASSVIDQAKLPTTTTGTNTQPEVHRGFFGSIGHFFSNIFGF